MADEPSRPLGIKTQTTSWHLADGTPTDDPDKAVSGEVTTVYADGRVEHRLLQRASEPLRD